MSEFYERAVQLRATIEPHYNCCAAVVIPFAEKAGIPEETLMRITMNFRGGMRNGGRCGAMVGGIMVLGMFGITDDGTIGRYYEKLNHSHHNMLNCSELLKDFIENDIPRKPFCDGLVYEVIGIVEDILREKEVLQMVQ